MSDSEPHFSTNSPDPSAPGGASEGDSDPGLLVVISGPSGVGKTTIVEDLAERWPFHFSVSATTRPARPDEADGVDYYFVDRDMFRAMIDTGQFLEGPNTQTTSTARPANLCTMRLTPVAMCCLTSRSTGQCRSWRPTRRR